MSIDIPPRPSTVPVRRRLALGIGISLLLHGLVLLLRFGAPGAGSSSSGAPISVRIAAAPASAPLPEPLPDAPTPTLPPAPVTGMRVLAPRPEPLAAVPVPTPKAATPRKARQIKSPRPRFDAPSPVIAQDTIPNDFLVATPQPEQAEQTATDPNQAQAGSDDVSDSVNAMADAERQQEALRQAEREEEQRRLEEARRVEQARQAENERLASETQAQQRLTQERETEEKREQERLEQERLAQERAVQDRAAQEKTVQERIARERAEQERLAKQREAQEKLAQERAAQERLVQERAENERQAQQKLAQERAGQQADPFAGVEGSGNRGPGDGGKGAAAPGIPKEVPGAGLGTRARELVKGLDLLKGNPPPTSPHGERRVVVGGGERDVPLRHYVDSWRLKIERNGSVYYPRSWSSAGHPSPLVNVAVRSDGSVEEVTIIRSSGRADMDQAVRQIVRLNARYAQFPPNIASRYDVIDIRRIWRFDDILKLQEELP